VYHWLCQCEIDLDDALYGRATATSLISLNDMLTAISQICSLRAPFEDDLEGYAAAACPAVEIWLGKLDHYLAEHTILQVAQLLERHHLAAPVASYQGGLFAAEDRARAEHWRHFAARLVRCRDLGIGTLVVAADIEPPITADRLEQTVEGLRRAGDAGAEHGVRLALEFQAGAALVNNLQTAAALVDRVGSPWLGLCLDLFHFYHGPSKSEDLAYLSPSNAFHVQLCDVAGTIRELATDADRVLPGDGDFRLDLVVDRLRSIGYQGCVSLEMMNPQIWSIPPLQVAEVGVTALRKTLGLASM